MTEAEVESCVGLAYVMVAERGQARVHEGGPLAFAVLGARRQHG